MWLHLKCLHDDMSGLCVSLLILAPKLRGTVPLSLTKKDLGGDESSIGTGYSLTFIKPSKKTEKTKKKLLYNSDHQNSQFNLQNTEIRRWERKIRKKNKGYSKKCQPGSRTTKGLSWARRRKYWSPTFTYHAPWSTHNQRNTEKITNNHVRRKEEF